MKDSTQASIDQWDTPGFADMVNSLRTTTCLPPITKEDWTNTCLKTAKISDAVDRTIENIERKIDITVTGYKEWLRTELMLLVLELRFLEN